MRTIEVIIIGAGGFGREVADITRGSEFYKFAGYLDDAPDMDLIARRGEEHLGGLDTLAQFAGQKYVVGIGSPDARRELVERADAAGLKAGALQHPSATFGEDNRIGDGFIACAHVSVTTNVLIGRHVHINLNSTVGHDAVLDDFVTINPGVNISGNVTIGQGSMVGTGASVIQGVRIGASAVIGAGAVVTKDVPDAVTAVGVPARWSHD